MTPSSYLWVKMTFGRAKYYETQMHDKDRCLGVTIRIAAYTLYAMRQTGASAIHMDAEKSINLGSARRAE